jgi:hypothetical protein
MADKLSATGGDLWPEKLARGLVRPHARARARARARAHAHAHARTSHPPTPEPAPAPAPSSNRGEPGAGCRSKLVRELVSAGETHYVVRAAAFTQERHV